MGEKADKKRKRSQATSEEVGETDAKIEQVDVDKEARKKLKREEKQKKKESKKSEAEAEESQVKEDTEAQAKKKEKKEKKKAEKEAEKKNEEKEESKDVEMEDATEEKQDEKKDKKKKTKKDKKKEKKENGDATNGEQAEAAEANEQQQEQEEQQYHQQKKVRFIVFVGTLYLYPGPSQALSVIPPSLAMVLTPSFAGNLPYTATVESIKKHFEKNPPASVRVATEKGSSKCRGFAFIEFDHYDRMKTCLKLYHHSQFDDGKSPARRINVELT